MLHLLSLLLIKVVLNSECMWCNQPNVEIVLLESVQPVGLVHATLSMRCSPALFSHVWKQRKDQLNSENYVTSSVQIPPFLSRIFIISFANFL